MEIPHSQFICEGVEFGFFLNSECRVLPADVATVEYGPAEMVDGFTCLRIYHFAVASREKWRSATASHNRYPYSVSADTFGIPFRTVPSGMAFSIADILCLKRLGMGLLYSTPESRISLLAAGFTDHGVDPACLYVSASYFGETGRQRRNRNMLGCEQRDGFPNREPYSIAASLPHTYLQHADGLLLHQKDERETGRNTHHADLGRSRSKARVGSAS